MPAMGAAQSPPPPGDCRAGGVPNVEVIRMRRLVCCLVIAGLAVVPLTASASTQVYFGFKIGTVNAPPPPPVVFRSSPTAVIVPGTEVYVVNDPGLSYDVFRYNVYW